MHIPALRSDRTKNILWLLTLMCIALILISLVVFITRFDQHENDIRLYYKYSLQLMQGLIPYRDFAIEYPPFALVAMVIPRLMSFGLPINFYTYTVLFILENLLICVAIALLLQVISHCHPQQRSLRHLTAYVLLVIFSAPLLPWRYDLFPTLLTHLAIASILMGYPTIGGTWLGLGIAAKLYPVVLLPIFSIYYLVSREYRQLGHLLLGTVGINCLLLLPFILTSGTGILSFLQYHKLRGLQIESTAAGIVLLPHALGLTKVSWVFNYGSVNLVSPSADAILKILPTLTILVFLAVLTSCWYCFRREYVMNGRITTESLVAYITVILLTFIATSKVLSPQYITWLLPFAPFLRRRHIGMMLAMFALTMVIFPYAYSRLLQLEPLFIILLNIRNYLVILLLVWIIRDRWRAPYRLALSSKYSQFY